MRSSTTSKAWALVRTATLFGTMMGQGAFAQVTYSFENAEAEAHNTWDTGNDWATALTRSIAVSGVPTVGQVLRQVRLDLGSASGSNIGTLAARLTDPAGNTIDVFNAGYFFDTDFSRFVNITFRDHPALKRLDEFSNSFLGMPYSFGYYRTHQANSFSTLNTTAEVNGTWTFSMIENTGTEIQFNAVELVFGPPFNYQDITGGTANNNCAGAQCVQSGNSDILLATNVNYPQEQPNFPNLTLNGCNWNAEPNNTAWFYFVASAPAVELSVSGFTNDPQQTLVLRNTGSCDTPAWSLVGCPTSMFVGGCNTTTGNPTLYHRVCYDGGTKFNHGYTLSGLVVGGEYALVVDGQSGANSTFYIEVSSGADNGCAVQQDPVITDVEVVDPGCDGNDGSITVTASGQELTYSIDGGETFQGTPVFEGLSGGTYTVVVQDVEGGAASTEVVLTAPTLPVIDTVVVVEPTCGAENGSIAVQATGGDPLQYSIDGGNSFQAGAQFTDLPAGTYQVVVLSDGCTAALEVVLTEAEAPQIEGVQAVGPTCFGDEDGSITVTATGAAPLSYSVDGGLTTQTDGTFTGLPVGTYTLVVQDTNGCAVNQEVVLDEPPPVLLNAVEISAESCAGLCDGSILLEAEGADLFSLNNDAPQQTPAFDGLCPGSYTVTVSNLNGCTVSGQAVVEPGVVVQAAFSASPTLVTEPGTPVVFADSSVGAVTYVWDFAGLGGSEEQSPTFTFPLEEGTAEVCLTVTSFNGCTDTACAIITFERASNEVDVPNVFSPNGDGVNDTFGISGDPGPLRSFSLQVFNRWGQLIFAGDRVAMAWDGRQVSGEALSEGTYFWVLDYTPEAGTQVQRTGHVTLVR